MTTHRPIRYAPFGLRVVQRKDGRAAIVYRRRADAAGRDRLQRVAAISPLAFTASSPLLRDAVGKSEIEVPESQGGGNAERRAVSANARGLTTGPFHPLDAAWGARVAAYAIIAAGLRNGERLMLAANHLRHTDADEAAIWLGMLSRNENSRALRALRILMEAVQ